MSNTKRFPGIPDPAPTMEGIFPVVTALKETVEVVTGQRRRVKTDAAVTWGDLVRLGIIRQDQVPSD